MTLFPIETKRRLSESILWKWQRAYFEREGMNAWRSGTVPHHITCSPVLADAYVDILIGLFRDCRCSPDQPFYIVELGAGSGRLGYLILRRLLDRLKAFPLPGVRIKYVLTDFTRQNVDYWRPHGWLQDFIEEGVLDVAQFDAAASDVLHLEISGKRLTADSVKNPLILIANYFFDSIPQDAFRIQDGQLQEMRVEVSSTQQEPDSLDPDILGRIELGHHYDAAPEDYYENQEWNEILRGYCERFPQADVLFPVGALRCIEKLEHIAGAGLALLSADREHHCEVANPEEFGPPKLFCHGSISLPVDYQIIGEYFRRRGGMVLHPDRRNAYINVSTFVIAPHAGECIETHLAYERAIGKFGPDEFFTLKEGIEELYGALTLSQIMVFIRLSSWDYMRFLRALPVLHDRLVDASDFEKGELYKLICSVWDSYFPIGEREDLAFLMGELLLRMEYYGEALEFFRHSEGLYGEQCATTLNMGLCFFGLGQFALANQCAERVLEIDPESDVARTLQAEAQQVDSRSGDAQS